MTACNQTCGNLMSDYFSPHNIHGSQSSWPAIGKSEESHQKVITSNQLLPSNHLSPTMHHTGAPQRELGTIRCKMWRLVQARRRLKMLVNGKNFEGILRSACIRVNVMSVRILLLASTNPIPTSAPSQSVDCRVEGVIALPHIVAHQHRQN